MVETKRKKISIKLFRGVSAASGKQAKVLEALGLRRTNAVVAHFDSPTILGMIKKVSHLVQVQDAE
jgi:large subunit ribosomal protein L30